MCLFKIHQARDSSLIHSCFLVVSGRLSESHAFLKLLLSQLTEIRFFFFQILQTSYSHKNIVKCREYLRQVALGLSANQFISYENLFTYIYGTTSESIPHLMPEPQEPPKKKNPKVSFGIVRCIFFFQNLVA